MNPQTKLSASRIKTFQSCSWLYWCKYKQKLPDPSNDGAKRGSICHLVFEVMGKKGRRRRVTSMLKKGDIFHDKAIERLVMKHAVREGVDDPENLQLIKDMTLNGLQYDFFGDSNHRPTKSESELAFEIKTETYWIRGFIDKLFLYKKNKYARIRDFKSSKSVFNEAEASNNLQDLAYSLAVKTLFPDYETRQSEFLFLKFDLDHATPSDENSGVVIMDPITNDELRGFEIELAELQRQIDTFDERQARSNFAKYKGYPDDNTFSKKLLCGFADYPGHLKKDGGKRWHCAYKFAFYYYHVYDSEKNFVGSYQEEEFDESVVPEGGDYEMKYYEGCPAWK